jgi:hypothetical protein
LNKRTSVAFYLILSTIGAVFVLVLLGDAPEDPDTDRSERLVVIVAFVLSCLFGISLALWPNWTGRLRATDVGHGEGEVAHGRTRARIGHHPDCEPFGAHRLSIGDRVLCRGCFGLALGSLLAILLAVVYLLMPALFPSSSFPLLLVLGAVLIAQNFVETAVLSRSAQFHIVSNVLFVSGLFLVVMAVFLATGDATYGVLVVIISFLWLDTRIQLSGWNHVRTCAGCPEDCTAYSL